MSKRLAFVVGLQKSSVKEHAYELKRGQDDASVIHSLVGGFFARVSSNYQNGWSCFVNDEMSKYPEINESLSILLRHLQCDNPEFGAKYIFGNGVIVFSNPHKHPRIVNAIRGFMEIFSLCGISSPETCSREEATEAYYSDRSFMIYRLRNYKGFDFLKTPKTVARIESVHQLPQVGDAANENFEESSEIHDDVLYVDDQPIVVENNKKQKTGTEVVPL